MSAARELNAAIRLLSNAAYKCGETDGRDQSPSLQAKHAAAMDAALSKASVAAEDALTEAYAEGRKDEAEEAQKLSADLLGVLNDVLAWATPVEPQKAAEAMLRAMAFINKAAGSAA
jgi:hypothetical protein